MKTAFFSLVGIFAINAVGMYYGWYLLFDWFDVVLHSLGGFFVAMFFAAYLGEQASGASKLKNTLIILGVTSFIGVTWEFAEYIANAVLSPIIYNSFEIKTYFMGDLDDTMNDLAMDIIGAGAFAFLHLLRRGKAH